MSNETQSNETTPGNQEYRLLKKGETILETDEIYDDHAKTWVHPRHTVGTPAPDPRYTAHRQYRRAVQVKEATAPTLHALKTWPRFFDLVISGRKTFEVRRDDRDFKAGDTLLLQEWEDMQYAYTGREVRACVLDVFSLRPFYDAVGIRISLESDPVAETDGKWGVSWSFPAGAEEGTFDTRAEAVACIADMPKESFDTMHVLYGESWFPTPYVERIIEDIEEEYYNNVRLEEPEPYLEEHLITSREALHADLEQAIRAVFRRHLKPIELWSEDCELSGDEAREEIGEDEIEEGEDEDA